MLAPCACSQLIISSNSTITQHTFKEVPSSDSFLTPSPGLGGEVEGQPGLVHEYERTVNLNLEGASRIWVGACLSAELMENEILLIVQSQNQSLLLIVNELEMPLLRQFGIIRVDDGVLALLEDCVVRGDTQ